MKNEYELHMFFTPYLHPDSFSVIISLVGQNAHSWSRVIIPTNGVFRPSAGLRSVVCR